MVDLNEGMEPHLDPEVSEALDDLILGGDNRVVVGEEFLPIDPLGPSYSWVTLHERVFITWFENKASTDEEFSFLSEPKAIELSTEEAETFNDLLNHQLDQLQAVMQGFIENRKCPLPDCADPDAPVSAEQDIGLIPTKPE